MPVYQRIRDALAVAVIRDAQTQEIVQRLHGRALVQLQVLGLRTVGASLQSSKRVERAYVNWTASRLATPGQADTLLLQTVLGIGHTSDIFGALDLRWCLQRADETAASISTAVVQAGSLGSRVVAAITCDLLRAHLRRALFRDWVGSEACRQELLRLRVGRWLDTVRPADRLADSVAKRAMLRGSKRLSS